MLGLGFIGWFWSSPSWNGALICYGHAVLQLLGGSSTVRTGAFSRRSKKAEAQQLALKINVRRNPAALWLAADRFCGRSNSNKRDAECCSLPALALCGIAAFLILVPFFKLHVLNKICLSLSIAGCFLFWII
jgi:hypothetical protein